MSFHAIAPAEYRAAPPMPRVVGSPPIETMLLMPSDLLPSELFSLVTSLAKPRSSVAASCVQLHTLCSHDRDIHIAWRNCVLLGADQPAMASHPQYRDTHLVAMLKYLLPEGTYEGDLAMGFAPSQPDNADPIFTPQFLDYLYGTGGPLLGVAASDGNQDAGIRLYAFLDDQETSPVYDDPPSSAPRPFAWWQPLADALLIPVYLLRSGQLGLLERCLGHLFHPSYSRDWVDVTLPWPSWCFLRLDNRESAEQMWSRRNMDASPLVPATYPLFLATLALLEWSLPSVNLFLHIFPSLTRAIITEHALFDGPFVLQTMCQSLKLAVPDKIDRVIDVCKWMQPGLATQIFPLCATLARGPAPIEALECVFLEVDLVQLQAEVNEFTRDRLKAMLMVQVANAGIHELIDLVLDRVHMRKDNWIQVLTKSAEATWGMAQVHIPSKVEQKAVAIQALSRVLSLIEGQIGFYTSFRPNVLHLARVLGEHFDICVLDIILDKAGANLTRCQCVILLVCIHGTSIFPDLTASFNQVLDLLETATNLISVRRLSCIANLLYHATSLAPDFDVVRWSVAWPASRLAVLVAAVIIATSFADPVLLKLVSEDDQLKGIDLLAPTANVVLTSDVPGFDCPVPSFFDALTPYLRAALAHYIRDTMLDATTHGRDLDDAYLAVRLCTWLVRLDTRFVPSVIGMDLDASLNNQVVQFIAGSVPERDRASAKVSRGMVELVAQDKVDEATTLWTGLAGTDRQTDVVKRMVGWITEVEGCLHDPGGVRWIEVKNQTLAILG